MTWTPPDWARPPRTADGRTDWRALGRRTLWVVALLFAAGAIAAAALVAAVWPTAPGIEQLRALQTAKPSVLMSADGKVLTSFVRAQQEAVPLAKISPHVKQALIATEDQRFYEHRGVDVRRTVAALFNTMRGQTQGGSTITQQLARNLFPEEIGRSRTTTRKLKELITALRIERAYTKDQILETYLNSAPFLYNVIGIEMAARTYYDKSAGELDVLESATLVGMLKGTRYYNPVINPERARQRRNVVLAQLVRQGHLPEARFQALREQPLKVTLNRQPELLGPAPHFAVQARRWLIGWADEHDYNLYADGLVIHTTIDSRLQDAALQAVERQTRALQAIADVEWSTAGMRVASTSTEAYEKARSRIEPFAHFWSRQRDLVAAFVRETPQFKEALKTHGAQDAALRALMADSTFMAQLKRDKTRLEAGFVAIEPATGEVKAWVGSRDFDTDQYDHVAQAARQPGSTFKPFVYGAALESGLLPDRTYVDGPVEIRLADGTLWKPTDMSGATGAPLSLREGLIYSKNTITAQVAQEVGIPRIVSLAQAMGIDQSRLDPVPSLALGTSPVTLLEMASGYATIAQQGTYHKPVSIKRITDRQGKVLAEFGTETRRAMSPDSAADLIDMMRGVVTRGTGTLLKSRFGVPGDVAGKTGTSQLNADGWFIALHPHLVAGAWVGFNDSRVAMRSDYWGQGGHNALLLVGDFLKSSVKGGLISAKPTFPPPRHPPPPPMPLPEPLPQSNLADPQLRPEDQPAHAPPEVIVRQDGSGTIAIGDKASIATSRRAADAPRSAEELERVMRSMGRDPRTGEPHASQPSEISVMPQPSSADSSSPAPSQ
ncbi:transglycosylase domain-containing protein [Piscinibacter sp. XHJ-5]|uniref:penicillin-binding protein 1A n=1 Tax=Piscinibacter sp. XHJ-5 TaxID=3037797 RepID=UPI002452D7ED|nr:transglycosylase domain-containing protein [Piscinibacter sp. XHJ-5]